MLEPLLDAVRPITGLRGRPCKRPEKLHADKGYDVDRCRAAGCQRGIARRGIESSGRLGRRWVMERTRAWLEPYLPLVVRSAAGGDASGAADAGALIGWKRATS